MQQLQRYPKSSFFLFTAILGILAIVSCNKASTQSAASPTPHPPFLPYASPTQTNPEDKMPRVRPEVAMKEFESNEAIIIDVRGTSTYQQEHIKGAIDFPLDRLNQGDFKGLPRDKKIIAYCTWVAEHTSARAAFLLDQAGFKNVGALLGGLHAWEAAGGPIEKSTGPTTSNDSATPTSGKDKKPK